MSTATTPADLTKLRDPQRPLALLFGVVLVTLGVVDFLGVQVTDGLLLGVFAIGPVTNVVHVLTGLLGIVLSRYAGAATLFNKLGGLIYLLVFVFGAIGTLAGIGATGWNTHALHLLLAVVVGAVGFGVGKSTPS